MQIEEELKLEDDAASKDRLTISRRNWRIFGALQRDEAQGGERDKLARVIWKS